MKKVEQIFNERGEVTFMYEGTQYTVVKKREEAYCSNIYFDGKNKILRIVDDFGSAEVGGVKVGRIKSGLELCEND